MNLTDFLIIYLACGAPFGVYYFLKHRREKMLWLKTLFNFVFWMPFALTLLRRNLQFRNPFSNTESSSSVNNKEKKSLDAISKRIESMLVESDLEISIYEFRETVERYVGLTLAAKSDAAIAEHEREIFRAASKKNVELGALCLHRRNRKRLSFHQTEARAVFLSLIAQLTKSVNQIELGDLAIEFAEVLGDQTVRQNLEKTFAASQTEERRSVVKLEKELWKPPTRRPQPAKPISHLQTLKATVNLRSED